MKLTFLGTRGFIEARNRSHRMHSSLLVRHGRARVVLDCGEDWSGRLAGLAPDAILVTHAHPDHAWGLRDGAPCSVYASEEAWRAMRGFALRAGQRRVLPPGRRTRIAGITFEAFPVVHSLRAPAVGYRISAGGVHVFYVPDVVFIPQQARALSVLDLYIGDGASLFRPVVRFRDRVPFGHASIRTQLEWCAAEGVKKAVFTHCGSQIVAGDERMCKTRIRTMGRVRGLSARLAYDGLQIAFQNKHGP